MDIVNMNIKLYILSLGDIALILTGVFSSVDEDIRIAAAVVGVAVGILTSLKLYQDIKIRKLDRKNKELDIKIKERELELLNE